MSESEQLLLRALDLQELRKHRREKWRSFPEDVLPFPVAEMDFPIAAPIRNLLIEMVERSDLGYLGPIPELGLSFADFAKRRWGWSADATQVRVAADVGVGVVEVLRVLTSPGDKILINSPVYPNFWSWSAETYLEQVDVPFLESESAVNGSHWIINWDGIESAYASGIKAHLISNPHNPLGRVFTRDELARFAELAARYQVYILSDEIHAPLTFAESTFTPFLQVSDQAREYGITITSASKGWNIAGLKCAIIITENTALFEKLNAIAAATHYRASLLGGFASVIAFSEGEPWLDAVLLELDKNRTLLADLIAEFTPSIRYRIPNSSYLAWLDLTEMALGEDPAAMLIEKAKVAFVPGLRFGKEYSQFVRLNFATSPEILREAFTRIAQANY
jgi:cystathionine beta-lyase